MSSESPLDLEVGGAGRRAAASEPRGVDEEVILDVGDSSGFDLKVGGTGRTASEDSSGELGFEVDSAGLIESPKGDAGECGGVSTTSCLSIIADVSVRSGERHLRFQVSLTIKRVPASKLSLEGIRTLKTGG